MARQLNVNLVFNANTTQAKQQMQSLQNSIVQVQNALHSNVSMSGLTSELSRAQSAVINLKSNLNSAFNVDTGKLDLTKFNQNLQRSGMTLQQYRQSLQLLGPQGQQAFNQLTQAIIQGQMPMQKTNGLLSTMMNTFGNSIKWSIAYGAINKITQGFREAFNYAEDLNKSLTNIRVVTGLSTNAMNEFAEKANKAAKLLATTTTAYTDAALIYYQQGLEGKAVEERAETTLKLANVTGQTAETVSDQMTAVWNNFYDGSKSLEYYADVLTALGAATASSTDEISQGLEKFAAVAETVGLSYEYATTALATVTAETRQSADVVGTAFKTLFARIQDLELGDTLEDGTTLGSYSQALAKVGVDIKTANGELKDMDIILNEMGAKWQQIDKDQQVALAKSVAGIRQYTQLIALMDNWETFEVNLQVAENAEGTLQNQQDIWAESWDAASKRVKASAEDVYSSLIDDSFFIDLNNVFADLLSGLDDFIEAIGGLKTLLPMIAGWMLKAFGPSTLVAIQNFSSNLMGPTKAQQTAALGLRQDAIAQSEIMAGHTDTQAGYARQSALESQKTIITEVEGIQRRLNQEELEYIQLLLDGNKQHQDEVIRLGEELDLIEQKNNKLREGATLAKQQAGAQRNDFLAQISDSNNHHNMANAMTRGEELIKAGAASQTSLNTFGTATVDNARERAQSLLTTINSQAMGQVGTSAIGASNMQLLQNMASGTGAVSPEQLNQLQQGLAGIDLKAASVTEATNMMTTAQQQYGTEVKGGNQFINQYVNTLSEQYPVLQSNEAATAALTEQQKLLEENTKRVAQELKAMSKVPLGQQIMGIASGMASAAAGLSMMVSGVQSAIDMFEKGEHTLGGWLGVITSVGFALPMLAGGFKTLAGAIGLTTAATAAEVAITNLANANAAAGITLKGQELIAANAEVVATAMKIPLKTAENLLDEQGNLKKGKAIALSLALKGAKLLEIIGIKTGISAKIADAVASGSAAAATWAMVWPIGVLVLAIAGLVAGIALLIAIFKGLSNAYNADAIAAEKARENAKNLADTYASVKEKYEELKQSLADYQESQNAINKLKEGTIEWKQAIQEANAQVIDLLAKYPELSQYVDTLDGGRMVIQDAGWEMMLQNQAKQTALAQNMSAMANVKALQAENKANQTDLVRNELSIKDSNILAANIVTGVLYTLNPLLGSIAALFSGTATASDLVLEEQATTLIADLTKKYGELGEGALQNLEESLEELGVTESEVVDQTRELIREQARLIEQEKLVISNSVNNLLAAQFGFNKNTYTKGMQKFIGEKAYAELEEKFADSNVEDVGTNWWGAATDILSLGTSAIVTGDGGLQAEFATNDYATDTGWHVKATEHGKEVFRDYMKSQGIDYVNADFKDNRVYYETTDGEEKEASVSYAALLEFEKQQYLEERSRFYANVINKLNKDMADAKDSNNLGDQVLASYLKTGDLSQLSTEAFIASRGSFNQQELQATWDKYGNDLKEIGIESVEAFQKVLNNELAGLSVSQLQENERILTEQNVKEAIQGGAAQLEMEEQALKAYMSILQSTNEALVENAEAAADAAVENFSLAKSINKLRTAFEDNYKFLQSDNMLEYAEALGAIQVAAEELFGLELSSAFVEQHLPEMQQMLEGSVEAYEKLKTDALEDWVIGLSLSDADQKAVLDALMNFKEQANNSLIIDVSLNDKEAIQKLNKLLQEGTITEQELEAVFRNANLEWAEGSTFTYYELPQSTKTSSSITGTGPGGEYNLSMETYNESTTRLPWIGDNPPDFESVYSSADAAAFANGLDLTKTVAQGGHSDAIYINEETGEELTAKEIKDDPSKMTIGAIYKRKGSGETTQDEDLQFKTRQGYVTSDILQYDGKADETDSEKKKRHSQLDEEIERYRLLNETVEDLERNLDNIGKAKDRAYGGAKIGYMQAERKELERNVELAKERLRLAQEYYQQDLQELSQYGIHANKDGQIENWDEILQKQIDKMKGMDPNVDTYEDEEQRLEDMKSAYDKYMQSLDEVKDAQQGVIDTQNAVVDSLLEEAEFKVEFKIETDEFTMEVLEHFLSRLEDDAFAAADAIALIGQQMEITAGQIDTYMTGINKVLGATLSPEEIQKVMAGDLSGIDTSKLTEQQIEDLKEYANGLMEVENQLREQHTAVHEKLTESIEAWNEEFDKNMAKFEKYNAVVENYKNIIDIVGKGTLGISDETMRNMYEAQKNIATDQLEAARIRKESAQATYDEMKIAYDNAVMQYGEDSEIAKKWKEQMDIAEESLDEATSEFQDAWQNALQAAADAFQHNVETIIQNFEKSIAGIYGSLEALKEAMERQKEINERYLQDYEKTYEINKLNRKITQDIAKTTSNKSAKELRDLQNELLEMSKEGNQVSKLDIEYMQKKYDLLVAEQALHDAQNAKSTVKLSKDSEGNYSYIYTADQNNVDQAMQTYEDAKYALEDWSRTSLETVSENIIQIYSAWSQAMQEIMMDNTLNEEERERKMAETNQYYLELMGYYTDEAAKLTEYGYQTNSQYHTDMADSINDSIVGHIMPDITDWKVLYTKYSGEMEKATNNLNAAILQFKKDIDTNLVAAGRSASTFETTMNQHLFNVQTQAGTTKDAITKIKTEAEAQLPLAVNAAKTFETKFNGYLQGIINKIGDLTGGGVLGAIQKLINGCKEGLRAQKALEEKDYSYTGDATTTQTTTTQTTTTQTTTTQTMGTSGGLTKLDSLEANGTTYYQLSDYNWYAKEDVELYDDGTYNPTGSAHKWQFDGEIDLNSDNEFKQRLNYDSTKQTSTSFGVFGQLYGDPITIRNEKGEPWAIQPGYNQYMYPYFEGAKISEYSGSLINGMRLYKVQPNSKYSQISGPFYISQGELNALLGNRSGFQAYKAYNLKPYYVGGGGSFDGGGAGRKFDTGGYTGEWGPEGRWAMLHQKEIVLNAHDTENLLSIISMVRDMNDRIELNARAMQYGLTAAYSASNIKSQNDTLQQEVHITAEFPNATNHSEIEEAFRNLTNLASQYANRKF